MMRTEITVPLSRREREVVALLLQGMSNKQIALSLGISERTVEFHLNNVYGKLQVASRVELILKLGQATGGHSAHPVESTVELTGVNVDNGNQPARARAAHSWRNMFSLIRKEVAMTIHISFVELENYLKSQRAVCGLLALLTAGLMTHYVLFSVGLYVWVSYVLLAVLLGAGSLRFGRTLKNATTFSPLVWLGLAALLPVCAMGFDQLYLNTILRYTEPISLTLVDLSASAQWAVSPEGAAYRSTNLSTTSNIVWWITVGYMLVLFALGRMVGKPTNNGNLATA
jgi:DNA-binding CsgD family transcriptional regulator